MCLFFLLLGTLYQPVNKPTRTPSIQEGQLSEDDNMVKVLKAVVNDQISFCVISIKLS